MTAGCAMQSPIMIDVKSKNLQNKNYLIIQVNDGDEYTATGFTENNISKWLTDKNQIITLTNGKIMKINGFDNDFSINYHNGFSFEGLHHGYIRFLTPDSGFQEIFSSFKLIDNGFIKIRGSNQKIEFSLIEEEYKIPAIRYVGKNYYWLNGKKEVIKSRQNIDPFNNTITITNIKK